MHDSMTVLFSTPVQYCTVLHCTIQYSSVQLKSIRYKEVESSAGGCVGEGQGRVLVGMGQRLLPDLSLPLCPWCNLKHSLVLCPAPDDLLLLGYTLGMPQVWLVPAGEGAGGERGGVLAQTSLTLCATGVCIPNHSSWLAPCS